MVVESVKLHTSINFEFKYFQLLSLKQHFAKTVILLK